MVVAEAAPPAQVVVVRGLRARRGARRVFDQLHLSIARGEMVGLVGPNGSGKTTLLLLLAGVLRPEAGDILLGGQAPGRTIRPGFAPQQMALYPRLTVEENLAFFARLHGVRGARRREQVEQGLSFAGLRERRADQVRTLSTGMQRRLNVACALVHAPEVLLLDEPTAGVDPLSRAHLLDGIAALRAERCTVLYTTHHLEEVERLCDRVAVLGGGRILAEGTVAELSATHGLRGSLEPLFLELAGREEREKE